VIASTSRARRTLPFDRPMTFANLAKDVYELIKWLGDDKADVMGYSLGAATPQEKKKRGERALALPSTHPESSLSWW